MSDIQLVCLHENNHLMESTIDLLNSQWPRSRSARLRSLEQGSTERFPVSLLLTIKPEGGKEVLIGHSKVLPVPYNEESCFVESVVIAKPYRGKGYGRAIMEKTEDFVKSKGVTCIYLTTHDQQEFYRALGYEFCEPVMIFGGGSIAFHDRMKSLRPKHELSILSLADAPSSLQENIVTSSIQTTSIQQTSTIPPPPPPPVQAITLSGPGSTPLKLHMKKSLL